MAELERVGSCAVCKQTAAVNTPYISPAGQLICYRCAADYSERKNVVLLGVNQFRLTKGRWQEQEKYVLCTPLRLQYRDIVIWAGETAWAEEGSRSIPLTDAEKKFDPFVLVRDLWTEVYVYKKFRCTNCGQRLPETEIAGRPLFAGCVCPQCWRKHLEYLEDQRKAGHICGFCRQPYGACAC